MVKSYKTEGIVLKRINFKETDRILTVFTKNFGKLRLLAKSVRKITSRRAASLEPFVLARFFIAQGRNLDLVVETEIISTFGNIRLNLKKIGLAYQICELVEKLSPESQMNRSLFDLLISELTALNNQDGYDTEVFYTKLLWDLGYLPKGKIIASREMDNFMESVLEGKLKSKQLLTKIEAIL